MYRPCLAPDCWSDLCPRFLHSHYAMWYCKIYTSGTTKVFSCLSRGGGGGGGGGGTFHDPYPSSVLSCKCNIYIHSRFLQCFPLPCGRYPTPTTRTPSCVFLIFIACVCGRVRACVWVLVKLIFVCLSLPIPEGDIQLPEWRGTLHCYA